MKQIPIAHDSNVLERLYKQFDYLQDLPCEISGSFIEDASNLGILESDRFLGFLMAYEVEEQKPWRDHFAFLSVEDNLKINHYRHIRPVKPWPQPTIGVVFTGDGTGKTTGTHKVNVVMREVGNAQMWWGSTIGVIWEAFLSDRVQAIPEFEALMNQLWQHCEQYLQVQGVEQVFTCAHDPEFDDMGEWYPNFLMGRGYRTHDNSEVLWKEF